MDRGRITSDRNVAYSLGDVKVRTVQFAYNNPQNECDKRLAWELVLTMLSSGLQGQVMLFVTVKGEILPLLDMTIRPYDVDVTTPKRFDPGYIYDRISDWCPHPMENELLAALLVYSKENETDSLSSF